MIIILTSINSLCEYEVWLYVRPPGPSLRSERDTLQGFFVHILNKMSVIVDQYFSVGASLSDPVQLWMEKKKKKEASCYFYLRLLWQRLSTEKMCGLSFARLW